jgi:hypothetical protein
MNITRRLSLAAVPALLAGCASSSVAPARTAAAVSAGAATISTSATDLANDWATAKGIAGIALQALSVAGLPVVSPVAALINSIITVGDPIVAAATITATTDLATATTIAAQTLALTRAAAPLVTVVPNKA